MDAGPSLREENSREMLECISCFHSKLQIISDKNVAVMFGGVQAKSLLSVGEEELSVSVPNLNSFYDEFSENE